jgi:hypothetical protein
MRRLLPTVLAVLGLVSACSGSTGPSPAPTPTPGPPQTAAALKLALADRLGKLWYCDPDSFPIQRQDEVDSARERWPEVLADTDAFKAILADLEVPVDNVFTDAQKLAVYQAWKTLNAIALEPVGTDAFRFDYLAEPVAGAAEGTRSAGTITTTGVITVEQQAKAPEPNCPICLARGSRIETPTGGIAVDALRIGDTVWTRDAAGRPITGTVLALGSTTAPAGHQVVHLVLADGRTLTASPGHPLADSRRLGDLLPGDLVDGAPVLGAVLVPYSGGATFDLVVSGPTGAYFVDGIALGSTID